MASDLSDPARWSTYFATTADRPPNELYDWLAPHLPPSGDAIDLGTGGGRGARWLAARGLRVTATDISAEALEVARARTPEGADITYVQAPFQTLELGTYDVAVACYTLFFLARDDHAAFWARLVPAVKPGGLFAGEFLGPNDTWAGELTTHTRAQVDTMLEPFEVLDLREEDQDGETSLGESKHWHVFHAIARKR